MTDTELRPTDIPPLSPLSVWQHPMAWSRRRVLTLICAGGALSAAGPILLIATSDDAEPVPGPISRGRGIWTSFGSVAVLSATREARHDSAAHLHDGAAAAGGPLANRTWSSVIRVQVEVHNGSEHAVLLSPGQFRLRLGASSTTVSPYDFGRPTSAIAPGHTVQTWTSYLAPAEESDLRVEYEDTGLPRPLDFGLSLAALPAVAGGAR